MAGTAVIVAILSFPHVNDLSQQAARGNPAKAIGFLRHSGISGRMLNDYAFGGYLIWAAPERKVFVDGRADVYDTAGVMAEYLEWAGLEKDTATLLNRRNIQYCLLARDAPVTKVLQLLPGWKAVYSDELSVVYVRARAGA